MNLGCFELLLQTFKNICIVIAVSMFTLPGVSESLKTLGVLAGTTFKGFLTGTFSGVETKIMDISIPTFFMGFPHPGVCHLLKKNTFS